MTLSASPRHRAPAAGAPSFDLYHLADRARFQRLAGPGDASVLIMTEDGMLCYANPAAQQAFAAAAPLVGRHVFSLVHRSDLSHLLRTFERLACKAETTASRIAFPLRLFVQRDRWRWFDAGVHPFTYKSPQADQNVVMLVLR